MRNLIALFACCCVVLSASANDPAAAAKLAASLSKPASASIPSGAAKTAAQTKKPEPAAAAAPAASSDKEDDAEVALSAKIAERLAELRERQQSRAAAAVRAKKVAEVKRRQEEQASAAAAIAAATLASAPRRGTAWSYEGELGPANWSKINDGWAKCGSGNRQSPIDLRDGIKVNLEQISFDYHPSSFNEVNNGHTIQVAVGSGNFITVGNQTYELEQFHFHRPSEEKINGKGTEMVMHLVHRSAEGKIAIVAVLLERGQPHPLMQTIWDNLPLEKFETVSPSIVIDPKDALPAKREYFTYMGSLSEPPCTEGVLYLVFKQPMQASPAQMALFSRLYPLNARPVQPSAGRMIKESN
ncbi:carbonic anhydrase family protein [Massilia forsythiae]|uniref:carbonic anhydrase n=1 Tax=Massilia forsythiae TaxID=2728020 RepID=A0A7Z2ZSM0_9BURK|nr:carbonic anhydrase family protein [Massilia forsythiae]QJE00643.1 carbonic anhydrase family protein [Massilia forsythiae]